MWIWMLAFALSLWHGAAMADDVAGAVNMKKMSIEECIDSAFTRNPALNAAALEIEKARILKGTAFNPPMTEVLLKQETTGGGGPENGVYFGQEFDFPTVYFARYRSLSAQKELQSSRYDVLSAEVVKEVSALYYKSLYIHELIKLNRELETVYGDFCHTAQIRLEQGESGSLELMNAQRIRDKNEMEFQNLLLEYSGCTRELGSKIGSREAVMPSDIELAPLPYSFSETEFNFNATPRGIAAAREIAVAEREISLAKNEFLPGLRMGATVQALIKSFNPYNIDRSRFERGNFMGFEVGVSIPLFFGAQSSRLRAANTEKRISLLNMESAEAEIRNETSQLSAELESHNNRLEYYRVSALPHADEIKRIARVSYELGDIDYIEYISNIETAYDIYLEYAGCVNDYNQTVIRIKSIINK